ncbi:MAG TPA: hypothetical protein D7H85_05000 [Candidatus Poseidoniales archaeon]|nr:MAG TPA: hypothetical protein D7H85_05000 [Candidatus Poseidoniales archaeon]
MKSMRPMSSASDGKGLIPRGFHVHLDCVGYMPPATDDHSWILELMREAVRNSHAREVHAHVVPFDGSVSPPGFAAVVLIDESHVTAHCYSDRGLLAIDAFTCGMTEPEAIIDHLLQSITKEIPTLQVVNRNRTARFLHDNGIESP